MRRSRGLPIAATICALILAALLVFHLRYSHDAAWRVPAGEQAFVARAVNAAAADLGASPEDIRRTTRPFVLQSPDRVCVTLRSSTVWPDGSYEACHARRDGRLLSSRASGPTFGNRTLLHRLRDCFWALIW